jgi:hypothetical protein
VGDVSLTINFRQLKAIAFRYLACSMETIKEDNILFFDFYKYGWSFQDCSSEA